MQSLLNFKFKYLSWSKIWDFKSYLYSKITVNTHWNHFSGSSGNERKETLISVEWLVIIIIGTLPRVILTLELSKIIN